MPLPMQATRARASTPDARSGVNWHIALRPGKRKMLDPTQPVDRLTEQTERIKASIWLRSSTTLRG